MLLTCPQCRSGLQVPDGTTAKVRCPACKNVFAPSESLPPEPDEVEEEESPKAKKKANRDEDEDEDRPRKKKKRAKDDEGEESKTKNRDVDPIDEEEDRKRRRKRRRSEADQELSPEERAARRAAFQRASIGVKLIWVSFGLFIFSMMLILIYFFQTALIEPIPYFITIAGVVGLVNWILAAIGLGLCLSGPQGPGHWGYGISAAVAVVIHGVFLMVLVGQNYEFTIAKADDGSENVRWGYMPTRLNATMYYMASVFYYDSGFTPRGRMVLSMVTGVLEMVRTMFIMMLLSCMSRAALDNDLAHKCTRAAGIASGGPGLLALIYVMFVATMVETNAGMGTFVQILAATVQMGVHAIVIGTVFPAFLAAREVGDAMDEPYQSLIPQL